MAGERSVWSRDHRVQCVCSILGENKMGYLSYEYDVLIIKIAVGWANKCQKCIVHGSQNHLLIFRGIRVVMA